MTRARTRLPLAVAATWAAVAAVALYPLLRIAQVALTDEPHPASVVFSGHVGYFWRAATALFAGALVAFPVFVLAQRDAARTARGLPLGVVAAALLLIAQATLAP